MFNMLDQRRKRRIRNSVLLVAVAWAVVQDSTTDAKPVRSEDVPIESFTFVIGDEHPYMIQGPVHDDDALVIPAASRLRERYSDAKIDSEEDKKTSRLQRNRGLAGDTSNGGFALGIGVDSGLRYNTPDDEKLEDFPNRKKVSQKSPYSYQEDEIFIDYPNEGVNVERFSQKRMENNKMNRFTDAHQVKENVKLSDKKPQNDEAESYLYYSKTGKKTKASRDQQSYDDREPSKLGKSAFSSRTGEGKEGSVQTARFTANRNDQIEDFDSPAKRNRYSSRVESSSVKYPKEILEKVERIEKLLKEIKDDRGV